MKPQSAQPAKPMGYEGKSRNVLGSFNMWAQNNPIINFLMFLFGWFTVPVEVLFRKNFGQRWLTVINFYAGLFVLTAFTVLQVMSSAMGSSTMSQGPFAYRQPPPPEPSFFDGFLDHSMFFILLAYLLISSYHFFRMWWRDNTQTALHSFDDGTSRFEPVAVYFMRLVNIVAVPVLQLYKLLLPKEEQQRRHDTPPLTEDLTAFTNTVFEPLLLVILAVVFRGITGWWFLISAAALTVYANWKEAARLDKVLDFRDSVIEATLMSRRTGHAEPPTSTLENLIMQQVADTVETTPEIAPQVSRQYPDLMSVIEEMNGERG